MAAPREHTHHIGPVCDAWYITAWDAEWCKHQSCIEIAMEECEACFAEYTDELNADYERWEIYTPMLNRSLCPIDATEIGYPAFLGAPGYGTAYHCRCNHTWYRTGTLWSDNPSLLTIGDVL